MIGMENYEDIIDRFIEENNISVLIEQLRDPSPKNEKTLRRETADIIENMRDLCKHLASSVDHLREEKELQFDLIESLIKGKRK